MALIRYRTNRFSLLVPENWIRLATERVMLAVVEPRRRVASIAVARMRDSSLVAAGRALQDHRRRLPDFRVLAESAGAEAVYRNCEWASPGGRVVQHQLFAPGALLLCSHRDGPAELDEVYRKVIGSLRVRAPV